VAYHEVFRKKFQTTVSQNFLAVTKAKSLKTCILPTAAINNYETAQGFYFAWIASSLHRLSGTVAKARATKVDRLDSIPRRVTPKACLTAPCPASCSARLMGGARKLFMRGVATDSPPVQHQLRKQPRGSRCKQAETGAPQTTRDTPKGARKRSMNET